MHIAFSRSIASRPVPALESNSYQSLLISLLRGLAALQVALAHLRAEIYPGLRGMTDAPLAYQLLAFATGFAHQAVVVFFLISGWLVGGSLLDKWSQPQALAGYAIDRISRLWTVLIPTFVLMLLCASYMGRVTAVPSHIDPVNEYSTIAFVGNLVGLQTIIVPNFGKNYALWSLANETWYYVLFPLMLLVFRCPSVWRKAASVLAMAAIASFLPMSILLYFSLWLLGAGCARVRFECGHVTRLALLCACVVLSIYYRLTGSNDDLIVESYLQDLFCSLPLLALLASLHQTVPTGAPAMRQVRTVARTLSEFSFTLYVSHVPAIALLRHVGAAWLGRERLSPHLTHDYLLYLCAASLLIGVAFLMYLAFEANTNRVRRIMKNKLLQRGQRHGHIVAAPLK